ncbi:MAG: polysaccharide deacetylase family protein [Pelagibacterales bacterium]|nr:polysaccharide deacetylase family protein [Pelagibacterales bacterium]
MFVKTPKFIQKLFPSITWRKENAQNNIWLTFDDGPHQESTPFILNVLKEEQVKATFFLVGEQMEKHPELLNQIISEGHIVANHSYSHKNGWLSNNSTYFNDIEKCQKLIPENKLFRPPYGKISPLQISHLKKNYKIILWDVLSWDFSLYNTPKKVKESVLKNTVSGSIIVFHNNKKSFKNLQPILKETIQELKQKGFSFSTTW